MINNGKGKALSDHFIAVTWWISRKGGMRMAAKDRRESKRIPIKFKVNCINEKDFIISFSKDISADGMFIRTTTPPEVGQKITLHFSLGGIAEQEVSARVVWVNRPGDPQAPDVGMGVKFIKPKASLKRDILNAVNKVAVLQA